MKALTVRQPWPWAIFHGGKDIENRNWYTGYRGIVAIHSSASITKAEYDEFYFLIREDQQFAPLELWRTFPSRESLPLGSVIGTVEIADCVDESDSRWFFGEYGFVLKNPRLLAEPIPFKGALGFWNLPDSVLEGCEWIEVPA